MSLDLHFNSANLVVQTGTIACSGIEKKQSDWLSLILVAKKLNLIQLPELTARSLIRERQESVTNSNGLLGAFIIYERRGGGGGGGGGWVKI